ncbi:MAG: type II secretion system protein [Lachnospiraceae bacterium]|nr:type II secretion system protein [Lachnospiraceae bacterium]
MRKARNNKGISLVEILIVVAIMSLAVGGSGVGLSLAYSRDAEKCAKTIDAALENTRMLSMSQKGTFTMEIDLENNILYIRSSESSDPIEEEQLQRRVEISVPADASLTSVTVQFDKSTGKVLSMSGESDGVLRITSENSNGKRATVVLVKGTGKHYVEYK